MYVCGYAYMYVCMYADMYVCVYHPHVCADNQSLPYSDLEERAVLINMYICMYI